MVFYSSVAVNTTVAVLTLLAGVAALKKQTVVGDGCRACNIDGICRTDLQYSEFIISGRSACEF